MSPEELLAEMRAALESERDAIRRLDAEAVIQASATKEKILEALQSAPASERPALASALGQLKFELRRNLVLLAHARDYLREAVELFGRGRLDAKL
jgi:hypothetical protein